MYNAPDTARLEPLLEGLIYKRRIVDFGQFERRQWHKYKCKYKYKYKYNGVLDAFLYIFSLIIFSFYPTQVQLRFLVSSMKRLSCQWSSRSRSMYSSIPNTVLVQVKPAYGKRSDIVGIITRSLVKETREPTLGVM
ncbi:hypothetical protein B0I73DRAFT_138424 [Yarrowia lipolytica]|nr:hypothetical protein B0I73DRAFT_138424 [Yarrowia lipolytica]